MGGQIGGSAGPTEAEQIATVFLDNLAEIVEDGVPYISTIGGKKLRLSTGLQKRTGDKYEFPIEILLPHSTDKHRLVGLDTGEKLYVDAGNVSTSTTREKLMNSAKEAALDYLANKGAWA